MVLFIITLSVILGVNEDLLVLYRVRMHALIQFSNFNLKLKIENLNKNSNKSSSLKFKIMNQHNYLFKIFICTMKLKIGTNELSSTASHSQTYSADI